MVQAFGNEVLRAAQWSQTSVECVHFNACWVKIRIVLTAYSSTPHPHMKHAVHPHTHHVTRPRFYFNPQVTPTHRRGRHCQVVARYTNAELSMQYTPQTYLHEEPGLMRQVGWTRTATVARRGAQRLVLDIQRFQFTLVKVRYLHRGGGNHAISAMRQRYG